MTTSTNQWAMFGKPPPIDLNVDPCEDVTFSWSGLKLVVDIGTDSNLAHEKFFDAPQIVDPILQHIKDLEECENEQNSYQKYCIPDLNEDPVMATDLNEDPVMATDLNEDPVMAMDLNEDPVMATDLNEDPVMATDLNEDPVMATDLNEDPVMATDLSEDPVMATDLSEDPVMATDLNEDPVMATDLNDEKDCGTQLSQVEECVAEADPEADASKVPLLVTLQREETSFQEQLSEAEKCGAEADPQADASNNPMVVTHQNQERGCIEQVSQPEELGPGEGPKINRSGETETQCTWPDSEDDDSTIEDCDEGEKNVVPKKVATFSEEITILETSINQEERETGSFSYTDSSDDELEHGTDQVTSNIDGNLRDLSPKPTSSADAIVADPEAEIENSEDDPAPFPEEEIVDSEDDQMSFQEEILNSEMSFQEEIVNSEDAAVSAARHLLVLANVSNNDSSRQDSLKKHGRQKPDSYNPRHHLNRLSELVESMYASLPPTTGSIKNSLPEVGFWTIKVSKNSGRLRMKRIKRKKADFGLKADDMDDELDRPPSKRHYKSWSDL